MTEIAMYRQNGTLLPVDMAQADLLMGLPAGEVLKVTAVAPRNPRSVQHHRWFFALLKILADNLDFLNGDVELAKEYVKLGAGHFVYVPGKDGSRVPLTKSISFSAMDQGEFFTFASKAVDFIVSRHGWEKGPLLSEIEQMTGLRLEE